MANAPEYVKVKRGIHVVATVGRFKLGVDRVTQERAIIFPTPAGAFPAIIDLDEYLQLGIAIVRDSGTVHDFTEPVEREEPVIERVDPRDGRPPEASAPIEISVVDDLGITESVRTELTGRDE
jgi:hypothetical protein